MTERSSPRVYTIPAHRAFADALAEGLLKTYGQGPLGLARGIVLVPTNRAARAISDAFVRRAEGGLLLPRLVPVGDPELDERIGGALDPIGVDQIPPAIEPMRRRMILARLVQEERARAGQPVDAAEALRLAAELARTLDQLHVERIEPRRLKALDVGDLSDHWQKSLNLLTIVLDRWPEELARAGKIDLAERRNRVLASVARRWRDAPPEGFVVAAGITSTAPAVAELLKAVAWSERGQVVLPGLSLADEMEPKEWDSLGPFAPDPTTGRHKPAEETHPQYQLKVLLDRMGVGRDEVARWRWGGGHDARAPRSRAIANALAPAQFTGKWGSAETERNLPGVRALETLTPAEEAQAIAIALREAVAIPGKTAALVTPDRALAARVAAHLRRWGIEADDSAGEPLSVKPEGAVLLALAEAAADGFSPAPLLALLKHPLVMAGDGRLAWLEDVRKLDLALRGPRPPAGLGGVSEFLGGGSERERWVRERAKASWERIRAVLEPLAFGFSSNSPPALAGGVGGGSSSSLVRVATGGEEEPPPAPPRRRGGESEGELSALLAALRDAATALAGDAVWSGAAGRALGDLLADLEAYAGDGPADANADTLAPMLRRLMDEVAVRPPQGGHPRVSIWGLIEARLQQADLVVLAGLNEGSWPSLPSPDPWLAPRIRSELGLASLERRIGLAAHDLANALGAPEILVTRARRDASAPTVASRFWLRLEAMTGGMRRAHAYLDWARALDTPATTEPAAQPKPCPPLAHRPRKMSVTQVDRLKADPYAFYANRILKLEALDMIDADPSAAWRGTAVHRVLELWAREGWRPHALAPLAEALFASPDVNPILRALWQPRVMEALNWIAEKIEDDRADGRVPMLAEVRGEAEIAGIKLNGRVDRIDRLAGGGFAVIDYKTGQPPSDKAVAEGFAMQLGLLGLIAERGGFEDVSGRAGAFEYWSLAKAGGKFGKRASPADDLGARGKIFTSDFTRRAEGVFAEAAARWLTGDAPFTAKLHPEHAPFGDYDQLMRLDEWYGRGGA